MLKLIILIFFSVLSLSSFANEQRPVWQIVDEFFALQELNFMDKHPCRPVGQSCFRTACESVGTFECDENDEMDRLRRACRGVWGSECINISKKYLNRFEYDNNREMVQLVNSCRGVIAPDCISYTCDKLGSFGCDNLSEIIYVNKVCAGN